MKYLNNFKYIIENSTVSLWHPEVLDQENPNLLQPHDPVTGKQFTSDAEAEQWAIDYINKMS